MSIEKNKSLSVLDRDALMTRISKYNGSSITSRVVEAIEDDLSGKLFDSGVNFMTSGAACVLAKAWPPGEEMNLDFLFELTADVCIELEAFKGNLVVNYVQSISSAAAEVLSHRKGGLSMVGLDVVDEQVIEFLAKVGGDLILPGCSIISKRAAISLASRKAKTVLNANAEGRLEDFVYLKESLGGLLVLDNVRDWHKMENKKSVDPRREVYLNDEPSYYIGIKECEDGPNIGYISRHGWVICVYERLRRLLVEAGYGEELAEKGRMPHGGPSAQHAGNIRHKGNCEDAKEWLRQYFCIRNG